MAEPWQPRPIRMPDAHLPHVTEPEWQCRQCGAPWPCETAAEHLTPGTCTCGTRTWWERRGPRHWHPGPRCHTPAEGVAARAADAARGRAPHYPPSHFYPDKPRRRRQQCPPYAHTPAGPGDVAPGTWVWVSPGGLHAGWGDIHQLAMLTALDATACEVWLHLDGTVHRVRPERLRPDGSPIRAAAVAAGVMTFRQYVGAGRRTLLPEWEWTGWSVADHLAHRDQARPAPAPEPVQAELFPALA